MATAATSAEGDTDRTAQTRSVRRLARPCPGGLEEKAATLDFHRLRKPVLPALMRTMIGCPLGCAEFIG
jgi:hypothetical protein